MSKKKVLTKVLIDHSGSMSACLSDAQGGYDTYINERKKEKDVKEFLSLTEFDTSFDLVYDFTSVKDIQVGTYGYRLIPRGGTAFNDAVAHVITEIDNRTEASDKNITKIVVIITDGYENSSKEYSGEEGRKRVKKLIEDRQEKGWIFIFLGANMDAVETASSYGVPMSSSITYDTNFTQGTTMSTSAMVTRGLHTGTFAYSDKERSTAVGKWNVPDSTTKLIWDDEQE